MNRRNSLGLAEKKSERWLLALTSIASFMVVLDNLVVAVSLSTIRKKPHATLKVVMRSSIIVLLFLNPELYGQSLSGTVQDESKPLSLVNISLLKAKDSTLV